MLRPPDGGQPEALARVSWHGGGGGGGGGGQLSGRNSSSLLNFKCCAVGDTGVGKTSMLMAYCLDGWLPNRGGFIPGVYVPNRPFILPTANAGAACITVTVKDTRGTPDADELRAFDCAGADCLLVCFSVVDPESYFRVESRWLPFIARTCPDAACILVGTKIDLRRQQPPQEPPTPPTQPKRASRLSVHGGQSSSMDGGLSDDASSASGRNSRRSSVMEVSSKMGAKLARKIRAFQYLECSSLDKASLEAVFAAAVSSFTDEPTAPGAAAAAPPTDRSHHRSRRASGQPAPVRRDRTDSSSAHGVRKCRMS